MKTKILKSKLLPAMLLLCLTLQSCSSTKSTFVIGESNANESESKTLGNKLLLNDPTVAIPFRGYNKFSFDSKFSLLPRFENFHRKANSKDSFIIANMIAVVQPELDEEKRDRIATILSKVVKKYNIKPEIFISIIDTESNFHPEMISATGDISIAQINVDVWNKEFQRMRLPLIDKVRVRADLEYAFTSMADILNILKIRYEKQDPYWFARYHSSTPKYKFDYYQKLNFRFALMESSENLRNQVAQIKNIELLAPPRFADKNSRIIQASNFLQSILTPVPASSADQLYTPLNHKALGPTELAKNLIFDVIRI
jgi:hypothetical protein